MKTRWLLILLALLIVAPAQAGDGDENPPLLGVSLSPHSFEAEDFLTFLEQVHETGSVVTWGGAWEELAVPDSAPHVLIALAEVYDFVPVILSGPTFPLDTASYLESARAFAAQYQPPYMGFGGEINMYDPDDLETFIDFFPQVVQAVKEASPQTLVFTIFQYEQMKGLGGGLFGGENNPDNAHWELLSRFPDADWIAFTTYPCLIYGDPAQIPDDYYANIPTEKLLVFTEIGWYVTIPSPKMRD